MKIALIEPYLLDYTGHYYNFVTELRKGFDKLDSKDTVNIFVSKRCTLDEPFYKILPEIKNLNGKNLFVRIFEHPFFLLRFYRVLRKIKKDYDVLVFTTADEWRVFLLAFGLNTKKPTFLYIHNISFSTKQKLILRYLGLRKKKHLYILSAMAEGNVQPDLISFLRSKHCKLLLGVPYPLPTLQDFPSLCKSENIFYISYLGDARKEKGIIEFVNFIFYCKRNKLDYNFILQCNPPPFGYEPEVENVVKNIKKENFKGVILAERNFTSGEYRKNLMNSAVVFLLYDPNRYKYSISAILLEAFSFGKPVVVRAGNWLSDQVSRYGGGIVVEDVHPETLKSAVEKIRLDYERYSREAFEAGKKLYEKHNGAELAKLIKSKVGFENE